MGNWTASHSRARGGERKLEGLRHHFLPQPREELLFAAAQVLLREVFYIVFQLYKLITFSVCVVGKVLCLSENVLCIDFFKCLENKETCPEVGVGTEARVPVNMEYFSASLYS